MHFSELSIFPHLFSRLLWLTLCWAWFWHENCLEIMWCFQIILVTLLKKACSLFRKYYVSLGLQLFCWMIVWFARYCWKSHGLILFNFGVIFMHFSVWNLQTNPHQKVIPEKDNQKKITITERNHKKIQKARQEKP